MILSEYIEKLKKLEKEYGDLPVIYAVDDEGNRFCHLAWSPSPQMAENIEEHYIENLICEEDAMEDGIEYIPNCICIN